MLKTPEVSASDKPTSPSQSLNLILKIALPVSLMAKLLNSISGTVFSQTSSLHELTNRVTAKRSKFESSLKTDFDIDKLENSIFKIDNTIQFNEIALKIFQFQAYNNQIYKDYLKGLNVNPTSVKHISEIPFLPIRFFKSHSVVSFKEKAEEVFLSSSTTSQTPSKHFVKKLSVYENAFKTGFKQSYKLDKNVKIIALLPSYLEREGSSLIYMFRSLMLEYSGSDAFFYKEISRELIKYLKQLSMSNEPVLLLGVSYALLDLCDAIDFPLNNIWVMETGGMKGRRKEMVKSELHAVLKKGLGVNEIHSEYGMTELMSQAYSKGNELFATPPWMDVLIREVNDPFNFLENRPGGINVIDLANLYSCSFVATDDLGIKYANGSFSVLGRLDGSESRGCNLLYTF